MKKRIELSPIVDLSPFLGEGELVALNVGPDSQLYALIALNKLEYRWTSTGGAGFATTQPTEPQSYRVVAFFEGDVTLDVRIEQERFNIHDIQPLPGNELLLACGRSHYRGPNDFEKNGRVYSSTGRLRREILLGDGIQDMQTTSNGTIWTSYFDEGVFGNFGWENPVGSSGLVAWDSHGSKLFEYQPTDGLDSICDCYALNVASDSSTWIYYYTEFPLVQLENRQVVSHWQIPLGGSGAFAVSNGMALFSGGYKRNAEFHLFELKDAHQVGAISQFTLSDENSNRLVPDAIIGHSNSLFIRRSSHVYRLDVEAAAST